MDVITITQPNQPQAEINATLDDGDVEMEDEELDVDVNGGIVDSAKSKNDIVVPGELITDDPSWMRGHGTYFLNEKTYSAVAGTIIRVNKLLSVIPFKGRYSPETGDHIVGRIVEVSNKRWKVDIGAEHDAILMLGAVNLPGGVLRRKSEADELQMRAILKEGDLLNAEVQSLFQDGSASLHTRSLKYGKLRNGVFVVVPSNLIIRAKNHAHDMPGGVSIILGVNGFCWIYKTKENQVPVAGGSSTQSKAEAGFQAATHNGGYTPGMGSVSITSLEEQSSWDIYSDKNDTISNSIKETISRYKNCLLALSHCNIAINETRLAKAYDISLGYGDVNSLVNEEVEESIGEDLINSGKMRGVV
ncbi:DEKNAAC103994 [Brettanomyces naardenensis]|uniref:DEKNAAC103994 n=1 Tax=Brettanomyces naardenensis TaxID=13370 RepID=A0A448YPX6_BRENA|nr:DEKNAAC103994 [Brettanomyces naardenensis]